ncbi:MAG: hypothetical protein PHE30_02200 [Candidatus Omnitrophica bacterium]|nr:hypothetical protein [Candidatus Omnitrophota bacterium]MDD5027605.1 hypothetical protein [Candidatus Omnitrophota bacterium]MDD5662485.1 hypothetical protein [Candidatus Omnitrophota bacterium]
MRCFAGDTEPAAKFLTEAPCEYLKKDEAGKYFCHVYGYSIGMHKTVSSKQFACVPIRGLRPNLPFQSCVYF